MIHPKSLRDANPINASCTDIILKKPGFVKRFRAPSAARRFPHASGMCDAQYCRSRAAKSAAACVRGRSRLVRM